MKFVLFEHYILFWSIAIKIFSIYLHSKAHRYISLRKSGFISLFSCRIKRILFCLQKIYNFSYW